MPHLILVKHSSPQLDPDVPAREWHLSDEGRQRCIALADRLAPYQPEAIASSDEPKAIETAQLVAGRFGKTNRVVANLHEHDRGNVGFLGTEAFDATVRRFFDHPDELVLGRETASAAHARFSRAVTSVVEAYPDKNIVIIAHGTVITLFVSRMGGAVGLRPFEFWKRLELPSFVVLSLPGLKLEEVVWSVRHVRK